MKSEGERAIFSEIDSFLNDLDRPTADDRAVGWSDKVVADTRGYLHELRNDVEGHRYKKTSRRDHRHLARWYDGGLGPGPLSAHVVHLQRLLYDEYNVPERADPAQDRETANVVAKIIEWWRQPSSRTPRPGQDLGPDL